MSGLKTRNTELVLLAQDKAQLPSKDDNMVTRPEQEEGTPGPYEESSSALTG